ncbi:DUF4153 domain-containing protein [Hymenobacter guriensis]|uniref:DUF4153 domain-containing protein n=1 Tax=Hymenobacter guriensis TaxID=2793065 RepID=A0ABS0L3Y0_9BACT|nr:DUF4153 domain-containing protein [Hymenobacter guriensis]MBG8554845.1 DUF4153 domain-containing protein [Hymenobacter guriensis]
MELPSLQRLTSEAARVVQRFPLTLLCAFALCTTGLYIVQLDTPVEEVQWIFPALSAAGLGLSLTLALALTAERHQWRPWVRRGTMAGALALLGVWYVLVPAQPDFIWVMRLALLLLGLHLLVAAGPYLSELRGPADTPGFWRYNETLFLRILTAGLYSGVLFAGCALALVAVDNLFDVKVNTHLYGYLFVLLATVFNTWFFLAGVPRDFAALEQETAYPKGLKLFTQFVLLPLVVLYLVILYAYMARILVLWTLPKGWVSTLVLALAVAGIFALLLIHPIRQAAENTWIRTFVRWFYLALFPLLGLLAVAIGTRVLAYGITEERYFVLILAAWLFCMAVYFLVRRSQGIIWIPASLALVAFLAAVGPLSAFAVARRSQLGQLQEISARYKLLQNGKLDGAGERVPYLPFTVRQRLSSLFEFFAQRNATAHLQPLFAASLQLPDSLLASTMWERKQWQSNRLFAVSLMNRVGPYATDHAQELSVTFEAAQVEFQNLGNGRYWWNSVNLMHYVDDSTSKVVATAAVREGTFRLRAEKRGRTLLLEQLRADQRWQTCLSVFPGRAADSLALKHGRNQRANVQLPATGLTLRATAGNISLQLFLRELTRRQQQDTVRYNLDAQALLEITQP